jgi:acetyl esterase/lipase
LGTACGANPTPEYAVPARREDLSGLPPAWIGVGTLDVFYDEDVVYSKRLASSGIESELVVVEGAFHGFDVFDARILLVQDFRDSQLAALKNTCCCKCLEVMRAYQEHTFFTAPARARTQAHHQKCINFQF